MKETDVVIIGAGPAGSTCANLLKEAEIDCVLVDFQHFPREKVCGGGLSPKAWHLLEELFPDFKYVYQPIKKIRVILEHEVLQEIETANELRIVSRKEFDNALLQRYLQKGGKFISDALKSFVIADRSISVLLRSGEQIKCKYLIGADGANSRVRKQLQGNYKGNILCLEQYVDKIDNVLEGIVSKRFDHGYYYRFPGVDHDVVGYGDRKTSKEEFRRLLSELGIAETKLRGANISVKVVESPYDNIMLIGDAGGFANKLTYEGIYYAIATGRNAFTAITEGVSFREANKDIFRRKRREAWITELLYSKVGFFLVKLFAKHGTILKRLFDIGVSTRTVK